MLIANKENSRIGEYDGFTTHLLIGERNSGSTEISVQTTEVEPNNQCHHYIRPQHDNELYSVNHNAIDEQLQVNLD